MQQGCIFQTYKGSVKSVPVDQYLLTLSRPTGGSDASGGVGGIGERGGIMSAQWWVGAGDSQTIASSIFVNLFNATNTN